MLVLKQVIRRELHCNNPKVDEIEIVFFCKSHSREKNWKCKAHNRKLAIYITYVLEMKQ